VVATWNVFHLRDGFPGLGPTPGSTWRRHPVAGPTHLHLNRSHPDGVAAVIRRLGADVVALQEVPAGAVPRLARDAGMSAVWVRTGPRLGGDRLRWRLGRANPDLWRTHQGNANALLVGPGWRIEPGSARSWQLNPLGTVVAVAIRARLAPDALRRWVLESRRALGCVVRGPGGDRVAVCAVHAHNARVPEERAAELGRLAGALAAWAPRGPLVLAGDLNAPPADPAVRGLAGRLGIAGGPDRIDQILARGLGVVRAPRALPASVRELLARRPGGPALRVRLSDHDPVVAEYAAGPGEGHRRGARRG
jgi:endonuclease/exonuclease/phosphatase family metal-dependent hydrolase